MARFFVRRLALSLVTLWLLATIVFVIANVLPTDIGRTILGPFASQQTVDALNERLGTNDPILEQYARSMRNLVTLDFGNSFQSGAPVMPTLLAAMGRSAQLAALALILTIPISIVAGVYAARRRDRPSDRAIVLFGVTSSSIPEFVTATFLVVVVGVGLGWLPVLANPPPGRRPHHDCEVPVVARAGDGDRVFRVHRADGTGRHDRGPPVRLCPDRDDEGALDAIRSSGATSCATPSYRPSPSSASRSATCSAASSGSRRSSTTTAWDS